MISHKIQVRCIDNEFHAITLTESGALHFHNHKDVAELRDYLQLQTLGGKRCACAVFWQNWKEGNWANLPDKFKMIRKRTFGDTKNNWRVLRRLQQARQYKPPQEIVDQITVDAERLPHIKPRQAFCGEFIKALTNILVFRGHQITTDKDQKRITAVDDQMLGICCLLKPATSIAIKVRISVVDNIKHEVNVVPHKNAIRALHDVADHVELELVRMKYLEKPSWDKKQNDITTEIAKLRKEFPESKAHITMDAKGIRIQLDVNHLTGPAAKLAMKLLSTVESKIHRVAYTAAKHRDQL